MRIVTTFLALLTSAACVQGNPAEDPDDWFDPGSDADVEEPIAFTDANYDFPASDADGIASALLPVMPDSNFTNPDRFKILFGEDEHLPTGGDCEYKLVDDLPVEVEGVVTLHPRFYYKTQGCDRYSDEKYYGSYFIQDRTGGVFVVGDSKVAHFDMGDRVRIRVRGVRNVYGLDMVYAHDVVEVDRSGEPIYFERATGKLGDADIGEVRRVEGTVVTEPDTFGQFAVAPDEPFGTCTESNQSGCWYVQLDSEINRRGLSVEVGDRVEATGPVLYSYSLYTIVIMRVGQLAVLD